MNFLRDLPGDWTDWRRGGDNWNRALNDLRYGAPRWKYFALINPPDEEGSDISLPDRRAWVSYEEVQEGIKNFANSIEQGGFLGSQARYMASYMKEILTKLQEKAIRAETAFFNLVKTNKNIITDLSGVNYSTLVNNSESIAGRGIKVTEIGYNNSIDFWTRVFYNQLNDNAPISQKDAFAIIVTSKEFYKSLTKGMERKMSFFSQIGALKFKNMDEQAKFVTDKIDYDALKILFEEYDKYLDNKMFTTDGEVNDAIASELRQAMTKVMGNYFKINNNGQIDFEQKIFKTNLQLATSVSKTIRKNLEQELKNLKHKYGIEHTLSIKLTDEKETWFYISSDYGAVNKLYQDKNKNLEGQKLVKNIIQLIRENINNFNVNKDFLDLKGFKVLFDKISIEGITNTGLEGLKIGALNFIDSGTIYQFLNRTYQRSEYWKSFNIQNSNQFLSGLLGELSANFLSENIFKTKMTGSLFSSMRGKAESINDLQMSINQHHRKGINIKHYIISSHGSIDLYREDVNFDIFHDGDMAEKYLGARDTQLLRFIVENEGFFSGGDKKIKTLETRIVTSHFPEFLRIHDYDRNSSYNLFFMINNVVYPTSYIYSCALAQIEQIKNNEQTIDDLFSSVTTRGRRNQKEMYEDLTAARQEWTTKEHELRGFKSPTGRDLFVNIKGLKINLVNLTLFS